MLKKKNSEETIRSIKKLLKTCFSSLLHFPCIFSPILLSAMFSPQVHIFISSPVVTVLVVKNFKSIYDRCEKLNFLNNITIIIRQIFKNMTVKNIQTFKKFVKLLINNALRSLILASETFINYINFFFVLMFCIHKMWFVYRKLKNI